MATDIETDPSDYSDLDEESSDHIQDDHHHNNQIVMNIDDNKSTNSSSAQSLHSDHGSFENQSNNNHHNEYAIFDINNNENNNNMNKIKYEEIYDDSTDEDVNDDDSTYSYSAEPSYSDDEIDDFFPNDIKFQSSSYCNIKPLKIETFKPLRNNRNNNNDNNNNINNNDNKSMIKAVISSIPITNIKPLSFENTNNNINDIKIKKLDDCSPNAMNESIHFNKSIDDILALISGNDNKHNKNEKKSNESTDDEYIEDYSLKCKICDIVFSSEPLHREHMKDTHNMDKPYRCKKCGKSNPRLFAQRVSLKKHIERDHEKIKNFECHLCPKQYYDKYSLKLHLRSHAKGIVMPVIPCNLCNDHFFDHPKYRKHMLEIHGIEQAYICTKCPKNAQKRYASKGGLTGHIRRDHEMQRRFKCTICPKAFYEKSVLEQHYRVHDGLKPYECVHCKMKFSQKSSRRQHIITIHLKEKRYKCSYCGKRFPSISGMKSHVTALHGDEKYARFECRTCHKRFYTKNAYYGHIDHQHRPKDPIKEKIKKGECIYPGCDKKYTSTNCAESVKYHLVHTHHDRNYAHYHCKKCKKLFYDRTSCRDHMKSKHNKKLTKKNIIKH